MAEEVAVARAGRQQGDGGIDAAGATGERGLQQLEEGRQPHPLAGAEDVAGDVGVHHPVGDGIADAGRGLRVRVDDAPAPVRAARQIGGEELDEASRRTQAMTGPQEGGVAEDELMRYRTRCQQPLRAIEIRQDALEQPRPLDEGALQQPPLLGRHDEGDEIDAPRLGCARRIGEQIVSNSRFPHPRIELLHAQQAGGGGELGELVQQRFPVRLDCAGALDQLVEAPGQGVIPTDQAVV